MNNRHRSGGLTTLGVVRQSSAQEALTLDTIYGDKWSEEDIRTLESSLIDEDDSSDEEAKIIPCADVYFRDRTVSAVKEHLYGPNGLFGPFDAVDGEVEHQWNRQFSRRTISPTTPNSYTLLSRGRYPQLANIRSKWPLQTIRRLQRRCKYNFRGTDDSRCELSRQPPLIRQPTECADVYFRDRTVSSVNEHLYGPNGLFEPFDAVDGEVEHSWNRLFSRRTISPTTPNSSTY
ncbi:hypothetical protein AVEN_29512-1 [Araneus ventricosus]|uniref:Uncharacterized protein n=1 Tax=Araneus ventricosus TaxID=182803 RepID=A0A4Y2SF71_ARAVE|nr:hypothetical protein AVEN_29512-1 [Araneus ventricosus]